MADDWAPVTTTKSGQEDWAPVDAAQGQGQDWVPVGGNSVTTPPDPTKETYDLINKYAGKDEKLSSLARFVTGIESSGGRTNQTNSSGARGLAQITPDTAKSYGIDYDKLDDPDYSIASEVKILKDLLQKAHGNRVQAAIGYDAGPGWIGTPFNQLPAETQDYARKVALGLASLGKQEPDGMTPEQKAKVLARNQSLKERLDQANEEAMFDILRAPDAIKRNPEYLAANRFDVWRREESAYIHDHPAQAFVNVEGFLNRPVEAIMAGAATGGLWRDPLKVLRDAGHSVIHPEDHDKIVHGLEAAISHDAGFKDISPDQMWEIAKGLEDVAYDTATDPFTYIPLLDSLRVAALAIKFTGRVTYANKISALVLKAASNAPGTKQLVGAGNAVVNQANNLFKTTKQVFGYVNSKRTNLDTINGKPGGFPFFRKGDGKTVRLAIESTYNFVRDHALQYENELTRKFKPQLEALNYYQNMTKPGTQLPAEVMRRLLMYAWQHGTKLDRAIADTHLQNIGMPATAEELKKFPNPTELLDFGGDLTGNFIKTMMPKTPNFKSLPYDVQQAAQWFKDNGGSSIKFPFTHGIPNAPAIQTNMHDMVTKLLALSRWQVRRNQIADKTAQIYLQTLQKGFSPLIHSGLIDPLSYPHTQKDIAAWFLRNAPDHNAKVGVPWVGELPLTLGKTTLPVDQWLSRLSQAFKASILGNPLPHGLVNLGVIAISHTNPIVLGRALKYMISGIPGVKQVVGGGIPQNLIDRLEASGARTSYWKDLGSLSPLIKATPGYAQWISGATKALDYMETAYRASYLKYLDKKMGTKLPTDPMHDFHELVKGQTVNENFGDYSNPTLLAAALRAIGGLYTVFRFNVVPKATKAALKGRVGQSLALGARLETEPTKRMGGTVHVNIFDDMLKIVGTVGELALGTMPMSGIDYATSVASIGPGFGNVEQSVKTENSTYQTTLLQNTEKVLQYLFLGGAPVVELGDPPAYEKNWPLWIRGAMAALGIWYEAPESNYKLKSKLRGFARAASGKE